jgi:hypothetical protein
MTDPLAAQTRPSHCVAARSQLTYAPYEEDLYRLARERHPRVAWWWAIRQGGPRKIAHCYVCDRRITHWAYGQPIPPWALKAIDAHKLQDRAASLPTPPATR